jgi:hypothetical protein
MRAVGGDGGPAGAGVGAEPPGAVAGVVDVEAPAGGGVAAVIDIEGSMYFDVEWEHVFLQIRLHDAYRPLAVGALDENRLALYMPAQRLSLTAGPLRLLDGDFPDRAFMAGIAEHNLQQALELLRA